MAWPPTLNTSPGGATFLSGSPTIRWGTTGINPGISSVPSAAIVVSCTPADEVETLYVENGSGIKVVRVMLWQGRRFNITIIDDANITGPQPGDSITFSDPLSGADNMAFRLLENSYNASRKEPGQRVLVCEYLTGIEGNMTPPPGFVG